MESSTFFYHSCCSFILTLRMRSSRLGVRLLHMYMCIAIPFLVLRVLLFCPISFLFLWHTLRHTTAYITPPFSSSHLSSQVFSIVSSVHFSLHHCAQKNTGWGYELPAGRESTQHLHRSQHEDREELSHLMRVFEAKGVSHSDCWWEGHRSKNNVSQTHHLMTPTKTNYFHNV